GIRFFWDTFSLVFFAAVRSRGFEETYGRTFRRGRETRAERFFRSSILDPRSSILAAIQAQGLTPPAQGLPQFLNQGGQGLALDELHGVEVHAAFAAGGVNRHNVVVVQMGRGVGLILEALKLFRIQRRSERQ